MSHRNDRNYNKTGVENYFWNSVKDATSHSVYARRYCKTLIRRANRRNALRHINDSLNNG